MMLLSRLKPFDEILSQLERFESLLLLACNGCEESFGNAEPESLKSIEKEIKKTGRDVVDVLTVDFLCEQLLVRHWLDYAECKKDFGAILVVSCGIGVQVVSKESGRPAYPACDTITMGARFGQAWGKEGCKECGQCILSQTGGICPLTACSKGLLNGPCGGSQEGRCEVFSETRECGWHLIYKSLEASGRKDLLVGRPLVKDFLLSEPSEELISMRDEILGKGDETL